MIKLIAFIGHLFLYSSYPSPELLPREQLMCIATAVYHEAQGESSVGQSGVAHVILNRLEHKRYPNTSCGVVYQEDQFSYINLADPDLDSAQWLSSVEEAVLAYIDFTDDPTGGALHFYAHDRVTPWWAASETVLVVIGGHTYTT